MYAGMLALATATAEAAEMDAYSANYILPYCKGYLGGSNTLDVGFCAGVVAGSAIWRRYWRCRAPLARDNPSVFRRESPRPNSARRCQLLRGAADKDLRAVLAVGPSSADRRLALQAVAPGPAAGRPLRRIA
jgi:hypothetical protein